MQKPLFNNSKLILCKKRLEKAPNIGEKKILKIDHIAKAKANAKAIAFPKWSVWVKSYKCQKHAKNHSTKTPELFCAKNGSKKHPILKKRDNFENQPSCKGYSPCKGYSLCKMVSLVQKLKMLKTCEKPFYKNSTLVLCKKRLEKAPNIGEKRQSLKSTITQRL